MTVNEKSVLRKGTSKYGERFKMLFQETFSHIPIPLIKCAWNSLYRIGAISIPWDDDDLKLRLGGYRKSPAIDSIARNPSSTRNGSIFSSEPLITQSSAVPIDNIAQMDIDKLFDDIYPSHTTPIISNSNLQLDTQIDIDDFFNTGSTKPAFTSNDGQLDQNFDDFNEYVNSQVDTPQSSTFGVSDAEITVKRKKSTPKRAVELRHTPINNRKAAAIIRASPSAKNSTNRSTLKKTPNTPLRTKGENPDSARKSISPGTPFPRVSFAEMYSAGDSSDEQPDQSVSSPTPKVLKPPLLNMNARRKRQTRITRDLIKKISPQKVPRTLIQTPLSVRNMVSSPSPKVAAPFKIGKVNYSLH
jgi:hypothetical protein